MLPRENRIVFMWPVETFVFFSTASVSQLYSLTAQCLHSLPLPLPLQAITWQRKVSNFQSVMGIHTVLPANKSINRGFGRFLKVFQRSRTTTKTEQTYTNISSGSSLAHFPTWTDAWDPPHTLWFMFLHIVYISTQECSEIHTRMQIKFGACRDLGLNLRESQDSGLRIFSDQPEFISPLTDIQCETTGNQQFELRACWIKLIILKACDFLSQTQS